MKGDFTRNTFDSRRHYSSVRMQQGRVQLDADWNEQQDIAKHRVETEAVDLIGGCGGPIHEAGFALTPDGDDLIIEPGRYYVDGLLCENEAADAPLRYGDAQPHLPLDAPVAAEADTPLLPVDDGTYLAYLDVWERHLTALEAPPIREVALGGPDTATRTQLVWQVKLHRLDDAEAAADPDCLSTLASWDAVIAPGTGELGARAEPDPAADDPCIVTPGAGFRRLENQLYRVEVHEGGLRAAASFKWSRDNGSVVARLETQNTALTEWTVSTVGRDAVLRFAVGQYVELTDDTHELLGLPGTLVPVSGVEGNVLTVDLSQRWPAGGSVDLADFPTNPKVRRWDGLLDGITNQNFNALEDGVQVRLRGGGRRYHTGDYWLIPARTATGDVEWPREGNAPAWRTALGIEHHYCRLALLSFDAADDPAWTVLSDCRNLFPPVTELTSFFYLGGDGQEALPDPTQPALLVPLAQPLRAGVANGQHPVVGARVRFEVMAGNGQVNGQASVEVATDAEGVASGDWSVDATTQDQVVEAVLLDAAGQPMHLPIRFGANLSVASEVAYTPADDCTLPASVTTVQEALDELCRRGFDEPGIHVVEVSLNTGEPLLNDTDVRVDDLANGLTVICDADVVQASVQNKPVCFVTLYLPFPFNFADQELWGSDLIGTRPLRLDAELNADDDEIFWRPAAATQDWLVNRLFQMMQQLERGDRVLAYLTLKGNFIWADGDEEQLYLDGEVFGALRDDGGTDALLPSGDRQRGGDLEMWFYLVAAEEAAPPDITVQPEALNFGLVALGASRNLTLRVGNTGNGPLIVQNIAPQRSEFTVLTRSSFTLAPGNTEDVAVRFTPNQPGSIEGNLVISSNDRETPQVSVNMSGEGEADQPMSFVQVIHNALNLESLDVHFNREPVLGGFQFLDATPFMDRPPGRLRVDVFPAGVGPDDGPPLATGTFTLAGGQALSLIICGGDEGGGVLVAHQAARRAAAGGEVELFIENSLLGTGAIDVRTLDEAGALVVLADNLGRCSRTDYAELTPRQTQFEIRDAAGEARFASFTFELGGREGEALTFVIGGFRGQAAQNVVMRGFDANGEGVMPLEG